MRVKNGGIIYSLATILHITNVYIRSLTGQPVHLHLIVEYIFHQEYMKRRFLFFCCILPVLGECGSGGSGSLPENRYGDTVSCSFSHVDMPSSIESLALKDYPVTSCLVTDSMERIVGYNYRLHSLDVIECKDCPPVRSFPLKREGPDGVLTRIKAINAVSPDSVWLYDGAMFCRVDFQGKVHERILPPDDGTILVETNYAMHTAKLMYDKKGKSLLYPVLRNDSVFVDRYGLRERKRTASYFLRPSLCNPDNSTDYADFRFPNVSMAEGKIIYNYPYESTIYTLDLSSGEYSAAGAASRFTSNTAPRCDTHSDYSAWQRYGIENTHFYDVMYLPEARLYARMHVAGTDFLTDRPLLELIDGRDMYLMIFDRNFRIVKEMKLESHRYSCFTGWCALPDAVSLFVSNSLSGSDDERLSMDLIRPGH